MTIFEKALKLKLRFTFKGKSLTTEDLFELELSDLDSIYATLNREKKQSEGESLLKSTPANRKLDLSLEILKAVFDIKSNEKIEAAARAERKKRADQLLQLMAEKKNQADLTKSFEDLMKEYQSLEVD